MTRVIHGDCRDVLQSLPDASVDSVVTDPPYELGFMGRAWDASGIAYNVDMWREVFRVLKPGGHLLAFGGTRTVHRLTCAIEDAGFEIRDGIDWLYASGFPKSLDVSKAIDRARDDRADIVRVSTWLADRADAAGVTRPLVNAYMGTSDMAGWWLSRLSHRCQVPTWEQWEKLRTLIGFGPDMDAEVWRLNGRKGTPGEAWGEREVIGYRAVHAGVAFTSEGPSVLEVTAPATDDARRWSGWGTALKPAREPIVMARKPLAGTVAANVLAYGTGALNIDATRTDAGRWPANVILSHAPGCGPDEWECLAGCPVGELGESARFFPVFRYQAKAPTRERPKVDGVAHPTVKPLALMRWLVQLVTPLGGTVLDPFAGSGATVEACLQDEFRCVAIEKEPTYLPLIQARMDRAAA